MTTIPYYVRDLVVQTRIAKSALASSRFLSDITRGWLKIVDDMFDYYDRNEKEMIVDTQYEYLQTIGKIQADIGFYQKIAKGLYEEVE